MVCLRISAPQLESLLHPGRRDSRRTGAVTQRSPGRRFNHADERGTKRSAAATLPARALVAQWIEHAPPKRGMQVRFLPGASRDAPQSAALLPESASRRPPVLPSRPLRVREHARSTAGPASGDAADRAPDARTRWTLRCYPPAPLVDVGGAAGAVLGRARRLWREHRPSYDPYGWLVWGYQTLHLSLDLGGAPSWKPLPYLFTVPFALFGHYELWLWMFTSIAVSLGGAVFAGRIAYRLSCARPSRSAVRPADGIAAASSRGPAVLGHRRSTCTTSSASSRTR